MFEKILIILALFNHQIEGQELRKSARVVDAEADPDVVEITFNITLPINVTGTNLTETISPYLSVGNYSTEVEIQRNESVLTFTFNTNLTGVILSYNVTLLDRGEKFSGLINLTSTLIFYTDENRNVTETSVASVCLGKEEKLVVEYTDQNWYIALVTILSFILGAVVAFAVIHTLLAESTSSPPDATSAMGNKSDKESALSSSTFSSDETDISQVIASDGLLRSSQLLELCGVSTLTDVEYRFYEEKNALLWTLYSIQKPERGKSRIEDTESVKREINKEIDATNALDQETLKKEKDKIKLKMSNLKSKHEKELDLLREEMCTLSPEVQEDLTQLLKERHMIEIAHQEHINILRLKEAGRRGGDPCQISCNALREKIGAMCIGDNGDRISEQSEAFRLSSELASSLSVKTNAKTRSLMKWRKSEVNFVKEYELKIRGMWNRFAKALMESMKTICRELDLDAVVRKELASYIKSEMKKMKESFEADMASMRKEFLDTCQQEKSKFVHKRKETLTTRNAKEHTLKWTEHNFSRIEKEIESMLNSQAKYDAFVVNLWNSKFHVVLRTTSDMIKAMKGSVIEKLVLQGASRRSIEEFIDSETKYETPEKPNIISPMKFTEEFGEPLGTVASTTDSFLTYEKILDQFYNTQLFLVEKEIPIKLEVKHTNFSRKKASSSQRRLRELINLHEIDVEKKVAATKQKKKKTVVVYRENAIRNNLETSLKKWQEESSDQRYEDIDRVEYHDSTKRNAYEETLTKTMAIEIFNQWKKKSELDLLYLDLNALERLTMILLDLLATERTLSPSECNTVIQQHRNQTADLLKSSSTRTRRRLEQVVRKRLHSPPPKVMKDKTKRDPSTTQVMLYLDANKSIGQQTIQRIREDSAAAKEKYEVLIQMTEQQATELRELSLKVIQALAKVAGVPLTEMNTCFILLLHHRKQEEIESMLRIVYLGGKDNERDSSNLLPKVRDIMARQKHRLAEDILRTDDDFAPSPIRNSNKLQRIKQPHHVTFVDSSPTGLKRERLSPLPDIRPEPVGRTSSPESVSEYGRPDSTLYSNYDRPMRQKRKRKKKSLKDLTVPR